MGHSKKREITSLVHRQVRIDERINSSPGLKFESVCKVNVIGAIADLVDARIKEKYEG
jgi:hypothetical protein